MFLYQSPRYSFVIAVVLVIGFGLYLLSYSANIISKISEYDRTITDIIERAQTEKPRFFLVKGVYLTAHSAADPEKRKAIINLAGKTELNAVVIDIKDYSGHVYFDSALPIVNELKTERDVLKNIRTLIREFKRNRMYVIARQTVFQDPALAQAKSEWAIKKSDGSLWRDYKGLSWVDPTRQEVWDYNAAIAREAATLGFDELNFDYIRFPSDGNISTARYADLQTSKTETMRTFFRYLSKSLNGKPVRLSADLFGLVLEAHDFDLNIGQRLELAVNIFDYICPMTYPSHYPPGHLGYQNPALYPYEVVKNGLDKAAPLIEGSHSKLRPWIQAFDLGAVYDGSKIRAQIKAVEESNVTFGWMLWNASNRYSEAGLKLENADI